MTKIVYDDGREEDFNEADFISRADLDENYISKDDVAENYVTKELYDKKKKQAKEAFKQKDLAERQQSEVDKAELEKTIEEKVSFKAKHGFDEIPAEILSIREANPNLTWEQAYRVADYHEPTNLNPNPWREKEENIERKEISEDELAELAEKDFAAYSVMAAKIESWEVKQI